MPGGVDVAFFSLRAVFGPAFTLAFRLKTLGRDNVPRRGAAILAANHASFLDPILIGISARRPVRFLVAHDFYKDRRLHALLRWLGAIPVGGDAGLIRSFRHITEVARRGGLLGIFPEGGITRDGSMRPFRPGAVVMAMRLGVPLVPIHVHGTFEALPRYARWPRFVPVTLRIGPPIAVGEPRSPSSGEVDALSSTLRGAVAALGADASRD
jgi:1-acyl-sn-glycerol-3-phosphate acyltransferase